MQGCNYRGKSHRFHTACVSFKHITAVHFISEKMQLGAVSCFKAGSVKLAAKCDVPIVSYDFLMHAFMNSSFSEKIIHIYSVCMDFLSFQNGLAFICLFTCNPVQSGRKVQKPVRRVLES